MGRPKKVVEKEVKRGRGRPRKESPVVKEAVKKAKKSLLDMATTRAAARAAEEVAEELESEDFDNPEDRDIAIVDHQFAETPDEELDARDVFTEAVEKAKARNTRARFRLYRDSKLLTAKEAGYSWEKLQKEFKGGYYKVVAVDRDHRILGSQSMEVDDPPGEAPLAAQIPAEKQDDQYRLLDVVEERARMAEEKAALNNRSSSSDFAAMITAISNSSAQQMQTMTQMMQNSSNQMQMMMLEMNKQSQAQQAQQMTLMTTLLTQKPSDNKDKFGPLEVMKMVMDAEKRAEDRTKHWYELVETKAERRAEERAEANDDGEENESLSKTLLKGLVPLFAGAAAQHQQQQQPQPTPEEIAAHSQAQSRMELATRLENDRIHNERVKERARKRAEHMQSAGLPSAGPKEVDPAVRQAQLKAKVLAKIEQAGIFAVIQQGVTSGESASNVSEMVLKKLENSGLSRQTVHATFTVKDFENLAVKNGVPQEAIPALKSWIDEFYEHIRTTAVGQSNAQTKTASEPAGASSSDGSPVSTTKVYDASVAGVARPNGSAGTTPVAGIPTISVRRPQYAQTQSAGPTRTPIDESPKSI